MYKIVKNNTETKFVEVNGKEVEIPVDWENKKLKSICQINKIKYKKQKNTIEYIDIASIKNYQITSSITLEYPLIPSRAQNICKRDDVLLSLVRPNLKGLACVREEDANKVVTSGISVISCTSINYVYIYMYLKFHPTYTYLVRTAKGSNYPALSNKDILELDVITPNNIIEQNKIANFLSKMENTISETEELIASMEKRLRYYVRELTTGRLRIKKDGEQINLVENEHFKTVEVNGKDMEIPVDWSLYTLKNFGITIRTGKLDTNQASEKGQYPFFSCSNTQKLFIDTYAFEGESLLVSGNGDPGVVKYYNGRFNAYQRTYVLQNGESMKFLHYCMLNFKKQIKSVGSVIKYIKMEDFDNYQFFKPNNIDEQEQIASLLKREEEDIEQMKELLAMQKKRFKWAMSELLSGRYVLEKIEEN